ncbi:activating signal cointegrator 1 complex subunit 2-like isoform X1 [Hibiscus syriacus]|uniref:Activating signal cointegrator 1 complex subunit 2-like isoform X1 n=1 Tax=Hibiscus syriacus TaxID=106335 RepID=A0A6A2YVB3_HIBSY|nr:interferon-related developmental regulator 1-like isoform X2 [Hibiscus syriacus]KAE8683323.1 activating signal cointegrator 1 complex subunit 2-like isoform X1 [Hibiscus syriacus]
MGKNQRKNKMMLDSDDDSSSVSSSSTMQSDQFSVSGADELEFKKDSLLDEAVDALYEKRGSTREKALASIIEAFNSDLQHQFVEKKFATLLHQCLNSIKKGSSKEIYLASHVIGLLALTVGPGDNAQEILKESIMPILQASKSGSESSKIASLLECLGIITFVGGIDPEETEKSMQIMWQSVHPKLGSNVVTAKPSAVVITAAVSAWSFLLTTMDGWRLSPKLWQESIAYLSTLLDKDDRSVRIAAGEALAVIFEMGSLEKFVAEAKGSNNGSISEGNKSKEGFLQIQGLRGKILNQVRDLSVEAGGKGSAKKDLNNQRNLFKDVLEFLEDGYCPETSMKIGGDSLQTSTWSQLIQLNFLRHFLGGGFTKHMQENEFFLDVFGFTPKRRNLLGSERISNGQKRMLKSPNSVISKARTQILNKQRMLSKDRNFGHFAVNVGEYDA